MLQGTLDGQGGENNTIDYSPYLAAHPVIVNLFTHSATNTRGIYNIQTVIGSAGDDTLTGSSSDETFIGGPGNDTLAGGDGIDLYIFADNWGVDTVAENVDEGIDTLDFSTVTVPLTAKIASVNVSDGAGNSL